MMDDQADATAFFKKAVEFHNQGRFQDALELYDAALRLAPNLASAHSNRGLALHASKRFEEALESYERALALVPDFSDAYNNRGITLLALSRWPEALDSFDRAIGLNPDNAQTYNNRGVALQNLARFEDALQSFDSAIRLNLNFAEAFNNRGVALKELKRPDQALRSHEYAIRLDALNAVSHNNRGNVLADLNRHDDALQSLERAIELDPAYAEAHYNRGNALKALKRPEDALRSFAKAIELKPDYVDAHWNMATCTLSTGRFEEGWRLYEWRNRRFSPEAPRAYRQPVWLGEQDIKGKTLFVYAEQGLGDTIQFCRYARLAELKGAKVIFAVQDELTRLMKTLSDGIKVTGWRATPPSFDYHARLLSLPLAFKTDEHGIPAFVPYLQAVPYLVAKWRKIIGAEGYKIGICWQGKKDALIDRGRSFPVSIFEGLSKLPNVRLISLQKNDGVEQLRDLPAGMTVETPGDDFDTGSNAFVDTAAAMESLDLVITTDTSVAHLAGALGRPVWVALQFAPEWRWLLGRADSPWYPTMRLFRQARPADWHGVFAEIGAELAKRTGSGTQNAPNPG